MIIRYAIGVICLMSALSGRAQSVRPDERGLWELWCAGTNSGFNAVQMLELCREFKNKSPADPLTVVSSGIEGWCHLKQGDITAARDVFTAMLIDRRASVLPSAGDKMARTWLTRMGRERVTDALKRYYLQNIEFPAKLEELQTLKLKAEPPAQDLWGNAWNYQRGSSIKGMETQRYTLESTAMGPFSDLNAALEMPYADRIDLRPLRMVPNIQDAIEFRSSTGTATVRKAGDLTHRISLAYIGSYIIVVTDGSHWCVLPKPR